MSDTTSPYMTLKNFFETGRKKPRRERHRSWSFQFDTDSIEDFARSAVTYLYIGRQGDTGSGIVRFKDGKSYGSAFATLGCKAHHLMPILSYTELLETIQSIDREYKEIISFGTFPQMGSRTDLSAERSPIYNDMLRYNNKRKLEQGSDMNLHEAMRSAKRYKINTD